jgi:P27 family predicted phage terminase small subunit
MPKQREPVDLIDYKARKHLTKEEKAARNASEVHAPCDNIEIPKYLNKKQKAEFDRLQAQLVPLGIVSNLDTGELARYCVALSLWERYTKLLSKAPKKLAKRAREMAEDAEPIPEDYPDELLALDELAQLAKLQNQYFNQCETCARALGLNISSRCRLIIPQAPEAEPENKFSRFEGAG